VGEDQAGDRLVTAAVPTTTTTTTVAAATITTATVAAATAAAAGTAGLTWTGLVHGERTTLHVRAIEGLDSCPGHLVVHHLDEPKAARLASHSVLDNRRTGYFPVSLKELVELVVGRRKWQIANKDIHPSKPSAELIRRSPDPPALPAAQSAAPANNTMLSG
jgi:hypothetical protein